MSDTETCYTSDEHSDIDVDEYDDIRTQITTKSLSSMYNEYVSVAIRKRFSNIRGPKESPYIQKRCYRF